MSRILMVTCLAALLGGCTLPSDYDALKLYLAQTPQNRIAAAILFKKLKAVYEPLDKGIPQLVRMTESKDPTEAVTAYVALSELCAQIRKNPTPQGQCQLDKINPEELVAQFDALDTSVLEGNWPAWYSQAHKNMKRSLEPAPASDLQERVPEE